MEKDKINEIYELIKKSGYIQSINIEREMAEESTKEYNVTLVVSTCPFYEGETRVKFTFLNVDNFKLGNINNFYKIFLQIEDVSDRQLEEIRYLVQEIEYNMISFACWDIAYEIL